ncbi:DAK2 domain-containing protein [Chloroflexota bacterium]
MQGHGARGRVKEAASYDGRELREMFVAAMRWLEKSVPEINALNVFPVPDGDCGTNMLLTVRASVEEGYRVPDHDASGVAQAMARGALMGARGNSGVILSQIFRGLAQGLEGRESFCGSDFADALSQGAAMARKALTNPVEGTILTVARDASLAAQSECRPDGNMITVMEAAVRAARDSVANTPNLLPVLQQAGVVDAGGQGLYVVLAGMLHYLMGDTEELEHGPPDLVQGTVPIALNLSQVATQYEKPYGYCTEFVVEGDGKLDRDEIAGWLNDKGECVIVVGDEDMVHIHVHTFDPGSVIRYGTSLGILHETKVQNMDDQQKQLAEAASVQSLPTDIATVAVVSGDGMGQVFRSLGVTAVVPGGQSMNPSTGQLLEAVESVPQDKVIVLPNNKNIIPSAMQVQDMAGKTVVVVPTETIPQGVAALLSFDYDADLAANASGMNEARSEVRTVEVTRAVRTAYIGDFMVEQDQAIAFVDGELTRVGESPDEVLWQVLTSFGMKDSEVVTIYYGEDTELSETENVRDMICQQYTGLEVEVVYGGQPYYHYIASVE